MKKQLLNLTMLLIVLLMGGAKAVAADTETLDLSATQTTVLRNLDNADKTLYDETASSWITTYARHSGGKLTANIDAQKKELDTYFVITKFDLSTIPSDAILISATFSFDSKCTVSGKNSTLKLAKFGTNWAGSEATWNNTDKAITEIAELANSGSNSTTHQVCDVRDILKAEKSNNTVAFAIYTLTAREQNITNIKLNVEYTLSAVSEYSYTINAKYGEKTLKEIESGKALSTDNKKVYFPYFLNVDNVWYKTSETSYAVTIDKDTQKDILYEVAANVVAFAEGESAVANTTYKDSYSLGLDGHVAGKKTQSLGTIPAGVYKITGKLTANGNRGIYIRDTENSDYTKNTLCNLDINRSSKAGEYSVELTIDKDTKLGVSGYTSGTSTNQSADFDYIYIVKTADVLPLSSDYKLSTYAPETDVDLTNEVGVKFYAAKVNGTSVALTEVTGKVKAGTGLVVENNNNAASVTLATATDGEEVSENALVGVTADMTGADFEGKNAYVLVSDTKFQKVDATTQGTLAKGKAYLLTGSTAAARLLTIGNPTAINGVTEKAAEGTDAIYNIQGVRVDKADASGLYIVNGKKYIKK